MLVNGLWNWEKSLLRTEFTLLTQVTGKLQNAAPPVSLWCWPVTIRPASGNQQSVFGEVFAVTGVRCCPNWVAALTIRRIEQLAVPIVDWRGARTVIAEGTGRSIRTENGKYRSRTRPFHLLYSGIVGYGLNNYLFLNMIVTYASKLTSLSVIC